MEWEAEYQVPAWGAGEQFHYQMQNILKFLEFTYKKELRTWGWYFAFGGVFWKELLGKFFSKCLHMYLTGLTFKKLSLQLKSNIL